MKRLIFNDAAGIAQAAADTAVLELQKAIQAHGQAVWVIAGGTAPMGAYRLLAQSAAYALDWSKVIVVMGDERCVPYDSPDANWSQAEQALLGKLQVSSQTQRPPTELEPVEAAARYEEWLQTLPQTEAGIPRLDHVWLGMGEDGHTLSLFPNHPSSQQPTEHLVIAVDDSPKPPPQRITLTFAALMGTGSCLVMAAGSSKAAVLARIAEADESLPVARAAATIEAAGGEVTWLLDEAAAGQTTPDA